MKNFLILLVFTLLVSVNFIFAQSTFYVSPSGSNTSPYNTWAKAATSIQVAVNAAAAGDLVLVGDGTYTLTTNIVVNKGITVKSLNGSSFTNIDGNYSTRCFYIDHANAVIDGFTIKNGNNPSGFGGGANIVSGGTIQNCVIYYCQARDGGGVAIDNSGLVQNCNILYNRADNNSGDGYGGGVRMLNGGITRNCIIDYNSSAKYGGGINIWEAGTIQNCIITHNSAPNGGGVRCRNASVMENTILQSNNVSNWETAGSGYSFSNNCATPALPGTGNITSTPLLVNAGNYDYRQLSTSPTINAGINRPWMTNGKDLDGNDRIFNTTVDMGPYEFTPAIPTLISPASASTNISIYVDLVWQAVSAVSGYNVQYSTDPLFPINNSTVVNVSSPTLSLHLLNNTKIYWRVQSVYPSGIAIGYSAAFSFTTVPKYLAIQGWPIGGATVYTRTPALSWYHNYAVPALKYDVLYSINNDMSGAMIIPNIAALTVTIPTELLAGTRYYWQVRTKLTTGAVSSLSAIESFFVEGTSGAPLIPQMSYPSNGEIIYTPNALLNWWINGSSSGWTFEVQINTSNSFPVSVPIVTGITNQNYTYNNITPGQGYFWRVRSNNGSQTSDWSPVGTFTAFQQTVTPLIPVSSWPIGNALVYTLTPSFYWYVNGPSAGLTYEFKISTHSDGTGSFWAPVNLPNASYTLPANVISASTRYYWKVRSYSVTTGYSGWSAIESFTTDQVGTNFVVVPVTSWPVGGASVYTPKPTFYWYNNTAPAPGTTYEIEVRETLTNSPTRTGITDLSFTSITALDPGKTYKWQVRSRISATLASAWSTPATFVTGAGTSNVAVPVASWPIGGTMIYVTTQQLSWYINGMSAGLEFDLEYANNPSFTGSTKVNNLTAMNYTLSGLAYGSTIYWRVRSHDVLAPSAYSAYESFVVYDPANLYTPLVGGPTGGVNIVPSNAVISWAVPAPIGSNQYELVVSDNSNFTNSSVISNLTSNSAPVPNITGGKTYYWKVRTLNNNGSYSAYSGIGEFKTDGVTSVNPEKVIPTSFSVDQNYPNPFNPTTMIRFSMPKEGMVSVKIYNMLGQEVKTLFANQMQAGVYNMEWNATDNSNKKVESGVYILRVTAGENVAVKKMILLK